MIELAPHLYQTKQDQAFLFIITCTHKDKYDWRFPTMFEIIYSGKFENLAPWRSDNVYAELIHLIDLTYTAVPVRDYPFPTRSPGLYVQKQ
jgi:hypothetical protein